MWTFLYHRTKSIYLEILYTNILYSLPVSPYYTYIIIKFNKYSARLSKAVKDGNSYFRNWPFLVICHIWIPLKRMMVLLSTIYILLRFFSYLNFSPPLLLARESGAIWAELDFNFTTLNMKMINDLYFFIVFMQYLAAKKEKQKSYQHKKYNN